MIEQQLQRYRRIISFLLVFWLAFIWLGEQWWVPLRPEGSWLVLKTLPLLWALWAILRGSERVYNGCIIGIWLYFTEALVSLMPPTTLSRMMYFGWGQLVLVLVTAWVLIRYLWQRRCMAVAKARLLT